MWHDATMYNKVKQKIPQRQNISKNQEDIYERNLEKGDQLLLQKIRFSIGIPMF